MTTIVEGGDSSGSNAALMIILAIVILGAIAFTAYYFTGNTSTTTPTNTTVVMPAPKVEVPAAPAPAPAAPVSFRRRVQQVSEEEFSKAWQPGLSTEH